MKKGLFILLAMLSFYIGSAQDSISKAINMESNKYLKQESAFGDGEWFRFKMSYSGFFKAGNATLSVKETQNNNKPAFHVVGKGWTTGAIKWFFKVEDRYESYMDQETMLPYKFIRKIDEGGHTKDIQIDFDREKNKAHVNNIKKKTEKDLDIKPNVQDMVSTFYYLRNTLDTNELKSGDEIDLDMFFDEKNYGFKLKFLGEESINTEFGNVEALIFRPYVMAGRVFKEEESLTLWVSKDKNKIPLRIKADLAVGSLRADLDAYKGLKHSFKILADN